MTLSVKMNEKTALWAELLAGPLDEVATPQQLRRLRGVCVDFAKELDRTHGVEMFVNPLLRGFDPSDQQRYLNHSSDRPNLALARLRGPTPEGGTVRFCAPHNFFNYLDYRESVAERQAYCLPSQRKSHV